MKEHEIRPEAILNRYLELSALDADLCFKDNKKSNISCVGCGGSRLKFQFEKNEFPYTLCDDCGSLFQAPRPSIEAFEAFY